MPKRPSPLHAPRLKSSILRSAGLELVAFFISFNVPKVLWESSLPLLPSFPPLVISFWLGLGVVFWGVLEAGLSRTVSSKKLSVLLLFLLCCLETNFDLKSFLISVH